MEIDLNCVLSLITTIKQGIKQKCKIIISSEEYGFNILTETRNKKTGRYMYTEETITHDTIVDFDKLEQENLIKHFIDKTNHYAREEQSKTLG